MAEEELKELEYLSRPVAYLEDEDFDSEGNLKINGIPKNKPVVVMIQAVFCGHCSTAKPAFQEFANNNENVFCATIQGDGERDSEKKLARRLESIKPGFRGFPDYCLFIDGKRQDKAIKGRREVDLVEFAGL